MRSKIGARYLPSQLNANLAINSFSKVPYVKLCYPRSLSAVLTAVFVEVDMRINKWSTILVAVAKGEKQWMSNNDKSF